MKSITFVRYTWSWIQTAISDEKSMGQEIITINLWRENLLLRNSGGVNCYLVKTSPGFILIDTGFHDRRVALVKELETAGCKPGDLRLIVITHRDLDHTGNCAYLREKFRAKIAIHRDESEAVKSGNMDLNRNNRKGRIARILLSFISLYRISDRFEPDVYLEEGCDLSGYGLNAKILHLPGHSKGSIGILTASGDLFCGDLLWNMGKPSPKPNIDNLAELRASIEKVRNLKIKTVYPGHGETFRLEEYESR
jgi:hydroxyacylglutathione hydrolase